MKIAASEIRMASAYRKTERTEQTERLEIIRGEAAPGGRMNPRSQSVEARLSEQARRAHEAEMEEKAPEDSLDPQLRLLVQVVELMTGKPVRVFDARSLEPGKGAASMPVANAGEASPPPSMTYDFSRRYEEHQQLAFMAEGKVQTADGREIQFTVGFEMDRRYMESLDVSIRTGQQPVKDPLVLDFGGADGRLSDIRFQFDLDGDGQNEALPMLAGGRGFLAFDRNDNGRIDDGSELFGPATGNGFAELAALDTDGNGWVDEGDADYGQLRVWLPQSEGESRTMTLQEANVGALFAGSVATPFELKNGDNERLGLMRASSVYLRADGSAGSVSQLDLTV
jgi:hypothetical protein